jgi:hypothetical protein
MFKMAKSTEANHLHPQSARQSDFRQRSGMTMQWYDISQSDPKIAFFIVFLAHVKKKQ